MKKQQVRNEKKEKLRLSIAQTVAGLKKKNKEHKRAEPSAELPLASTNEVQEPLGILQQTCLAMKQELERKPAIEDQHTLFCLSLSERIRKLPATVEREVSKTLLQVVLQAESNTEEQQR